MQPGPHRLGVALVRWSQLGFGRTSSTSTAQVTPRNLFWFKDGTATSRPRSRDLLDEFIWVGKDASRRGLDGRRFLPGLAPISMHIETWDRTSMREQEMIFGRDKARVLRSPGTEFTEPDFDAEGPDGEPKIALMSHVRAGAPRRQRRRADPAAGL